MRGLIRPSGGASDHPTFYRLYRRIIYMGEHEKLLTELAWKESDFYASIPLVASEDNAIRAKMFDRWAKCFAPWLEGASSAAKSPKEDFMDMWKKLSETMEGENAPQTPEEFLKMKL